MNVADSLRALLRARTEGRWLMTAAAAGEPGCLDRVAGGLTRAALEDGRHWSASPSILEACVEAVAAAEPGRLAAIARTWRPPATLARTPDDGTDLAAHAWWFALPFLRGTPWFPSPDVIDATPWLRERGHRLLAPPPGPPPAPADELAAGLAAAIARWRREPRPDPLEASRLAQRLAATDRVPASIVPLVEPLVGAPDVDAWQLGRIVYPLLGTGWRLAE